MDDQEGEVVQMPLRGASADHVIDADGNADDHHNHHNPRSSSSAPGDEPEEQQHMMHVVTATKVGMSDDAPIDRCRCCPLACYSNNCVMLNSVLTCFAMVISVGLLVGLTVTLARPHLEALAYVNGTCTTVASNYTGVRERCACGGRFCAADYPCLEIIVEYKASDGSTIESMLHEEEHVFTYRSHCSFQPDTCADGRNDFTVELYKHRWGISGKTFPCYHNPNGQGALRRRTRSISFILLLILIPACCSVITTALCCVVYCYCCPRSRVHKFYEKEKE